MILGAGLGSQRPAFRTRGDAAGARRTPRRSPFPLSWASPVAKNEYLIYITRALPWSESATIGDDRPSVRGQDSRGAVVLRRRSRRSAPTRSVLPDESLAVRLPPTGLSTRVSLLERLRDSPQDSEAWGEFVGRYRPLLGAWGRHWGLQEADAEDVAQAVLLRLAVKLRQFDYDPAQSFRGWLRTMARHAW